MEDQPQNIPLESLKPVNETTGKMRPCPHCGQVMEIKSPWKALWRMPSLNEWITLFMIIMILFVSWAYKHDVGVCKEYIDNFDYYCLQRNSSFIAPPNYSSPFNSVNFSINNTVINETVINETASEINVTINETNIDLNATSLNETAS